MWPVTGDQLDLLMSSHEMETWAYVLRGTQNMGRITILGGAITATLGQQVTRDGGIQVDFSVLDAGLLNPLTDRVALYTGVPGVLQIPIFVGRPQDRQKDDSGQVVVNVADVGQDIIDNDFDYPWVVDPTLPTYTQEMNRMIRDVDGSFAIDNRDFFTARVPRGLMWESDRGSALDDLAGAVNAIWMTNRSGGFVIFRNPYQLNAAPPTVLTLRDGAEGTAVAIAESDSREQVYNSVTVVVERTDNTAPIRVVVRDFGTTSVTRWGGLFGKKNKVIKIDTPLTRADALAYAKRRLAQLLGFTRAYRITTPHAPLLDPGDVIAVEYRNVVTTQVVETVDYPLAADDTATITTKQWQSFEGLLEEA